MICHRLMNTTPPMLMPVQDEPAREAPQYRIMITDRSLSILPADYDGSSAILMLRVIDATGRIVQEHGWNGATLWELGDLSSGTYIIVAQPRDGAPQTTRFFIP